MDRRTQILQVAYEILGREGLEGLHARSVAAEVGINHAAVHYYFPHRRDMLICVAEYAAERFVADRKKALDAAGAPDGSLEAEVALHEAYCRPKSRFYRVWASLFVAAQADEAIKEKLQYFSTLWQDSYSRSAKGSALNGNRPSGPFADPVLFSAAMLGLGMLGQLYGEDHQSSEQFDLIVNSLFG